MTAVKNLASYIKYFSKLVCFLKKGPSTGIFTPFLWPVKSKRHVWTWIWSLSSLQLNQPVTISERYINVVHNNGKKCRILFKIMVHWKVLYLFYFAVPSDTIYTIQKLSLVTFCNVKVFLIYCAQVWDFTVLLLKQLGHILASFQYKLSIILKNLLSISSLLSLVDS